MEWKELQTLVKRKIGYGIVQPGPSVPKGVPIIKVNNIISGLYDTKHLDKTTVENDAKYQRTKLKGGELIVTVVGTCGKTAIVPIHFAGCNLVRATCLIDIEDETICKWIKYYIDSPHGQAYINRNLNTTVQATLNVKSLNEMPIPFYSDEYTSNVVNILSSLDRKIELDNKINADLEEMAQAIFKNWFVDFEPFKDGKFVDSELGMIPEGWKVGTLRDITNNKTAKVKERNDVKVLSPVTSGELVLSEEYFTKQVFSSSIAKYKIVNKGDFAYNPARVNIGSIGRNEFDFDGCVSPVYVVFSVLDGYENYFDLFRKTDFFKDSVASLAIGGVRQSLSYDDLSLIETIIPSKNIVEKFNNLYNQMKKTIKANKLENSRLSLLRDTLLPRLMSGELEVPE
jgi:type I restriction enzyme S subunit